MMLVGKAASQRDFREGPAVAHQDLRPLHPAVKWKLIRRQSRTLAKTANKMGCTQADFTSYCAQMETSFKVRVHENSTLRRSIGWSHSARELSLGKRSDGVLVHEEARQSYGYAIEKE